MTPQQKLAAALKLPATDPRRHDAIVNASDELAADSATERGHRRMAEKLSDLATKRRVLVSKTINGTETTAWESRPGWISKTPLADDSRKYSRMTDEQFAQLCDQTDAAIDAERDQYSLP